MPEPKNIGSPITDFLNSSLSQIEAGLRPMGYELCNYNEAQIELDLLATQTRDKEGKLILSIIQIGGKQSEQEGHKIKIYAKKRENYLERQKRLERIKEEKEAETRGENSWLAKSGI